MPHREHVYLSWNASWKHLPSKEPPSDYMAYETTICNFHGYGLSYGTSLAKFGQLGGENNFFRQTHSLYI